MWHVSSRSGVATLRTAIHLLRVTFGGPLLFISIRKMYVLKTHWTLAVLVSLQPAANQHVVYSDDAAGSEHTARFLLLCNCRLTL